MLHDAARVCNDSPLAASLEYKHDGLKVKSSHIFSIHLHLISPSVSWPTSGEHQREIPQNTEAASKAQAWFDVF